MSTTSIELDREVCHYFDDDPREQLDHVLVGAVSARTGFKRTDVWTALERLSERGLVLWTRGRVSPGERAIRREACR